MCDYAICTSAGMDEINKPKTSTAPTPNHIPSSDPPITAPTPTVNPQPTNLGLNQTNPLSSNAKSPDPPETFTPSRPTPSVSRVNNPYATPTRLAIQQIPPITPTTTILLTLHLLLLIQIIILILTKPS